MSRSSTCTIRSPVSAAINRNARKVRVQIRMVVYSGGVVFMLLFYNMAARDARAKATTPNRLGCNPTACGGLKPFSVNV